MAIPGFKDIILMIKLSMDPSSIDTVKSQLNKGIKDGTAEAVAGSKPFTEKFSSFWQNAANGMAKSLSAALGPETWNRFTAFAKSAFDKIKTDLGSVGGPSISKQLSDSFAPIKDVINKTFSALESGASRGVPAFENAWRNGVTRTAIAIGQTLGSVDRATAPLVSTATTYAQRWQAALAQVGGFFSSAFAPITSRLPASFQPAIARISSMFSGLTSSVTGFFSSAWQSITAIISGINRGSVASAFVNTWRVAITTVVALFAAIPAAAIGGASLAARAWQSALSGIANAAKEFKDLKLMTKLSMDPRSISLVEAQLSSTISNGVRAGTSLASTAFNQFFESIVSGVTKMGGLISTALQKALPATIFSGLQSAAQSVIGALNTGFTKVFGNLYTNFKSSMQGIIAQAQANAANPAFKAMPSAFTTAWRAAALQAAMSVGQFAGQVQRMPGASTAANLFRSSWSGALNFITNLFKTSSQQNVGAQNAAAAAAQVQAAQARLAAARAAAAMQTQAVAARNIAAAQKALAQAVINAQAQAAAAGIGAAQQTENVWGGVLNRLAVQFSMVFGLRQVFRFLKDSAMEFASFDQRLQQSVAIMQDVDATMRNKLGTTARIVSKQLNMSADELAGAYYHLVSAGLDAKASLAALPVVANFAKAGLFDLATATEYLTEANTTLGYKSADAANNMAGMARISDVLTLASKRSQATIADLAAAITNKAGNSLRIFGKDIEEGAAALAVLANQGVKGAVAGERLDIFLRQATQAAVKHKEVFKAYGIEIFDTAGRMRDMADIADDMTKALGNLSDEQQVIAIQQLGFQVRTVAAVKAFIDQGAAIRAYEKDLRSAAGYSESIAKKQLLTPLEQWGIFKQKIVDARREIGEAFMKVLGEMATKLGDEHDPKSLVNMLRSLANWFKENQDGISKFGAMIIWFITGPVRTMFQWFDKTTTLLAGLVGLISTGAVFGFELLAASLWLVLKPLGMFLNLVTFGRVHELNDFANKIGDVTKKVDDLTRSMAAITKGNLKEGLKWIAGMDAPGPTSVSSPLDSDNKVGGEKGTSPNNADQHHYGKALTFDNKADRRAENAAKTRQTLAEQLTAMLAKHTAEREDDETASLERLERKFKEAYGDKIPKVITDAFAILRTEIKQEGVVDQMVEKLKLLEKVGATVTTVKDFIKQLQDQQAQLNKTNPQWDKYASTIERIREISLSDSSGYGKIVKGLEAERNALGKTSIEWEIYTLRIAELERKNAKIGDNSALIKMLREQMAKLKDNDPLWQEYEAQLQEALKTQEQFDENAGSIAELRAEQLELSKNSKAWKAYTTLIEALQTQQKNPSKGAIDAVAHAQIDLIEVLKNLQAHVAEGTEAWKKYKKAIEDANLMVTNFTKRDIDDKFGDIQGIEDNEQRVQALHDFIQELKKLQDSVQEGSKDWEVYHDAIVKADKALHDLQKTIMKQDQKDNKEAKDKEHEKSMRRIEKIGEHTARTMANAFATFYDVLIDGSKRGADAFENLGRSIIGSMGGALAEYLAMKAKVSYIEAADETAKGFAALADPFLAYTAPLHFHAALEHAAVGTLWAAAAGLVGGASASIASHGHGLQPPSREPAGRKADEASKGTGSEINIYIDGVDPKNPRHQTLIGQTVREYSDRGGTINIKPR
jgi:TP901 family phage tail tape measure protein